MFSSRIGNVQMNAVGFVLGQRFFHVPVDDLIAMTRPFKLGMEELILQVHLLDDVSAHRSDQIVEIVL